MSALLQCSPKFTFSSLRFLFSQSQFDHLRYDSLTLALSQKTTRKSTRSYSFIAHSLATQGFPVIVGLIYWFSLHSCQNGQVLFVMQYDKNTFQTHTPPIWFAIEAYVIMFQSHSLNLELFESHER